MLFTIAETEQREQPPRFARKSASAVRNQHNRNPKTIDNDINYMSRLSASTTAVAIASEVIGAAHVEATGAPNGIGLVK